MLVNPIAAHMCSETKSLHLPVVADMLNDSSCHLAFSHVQYTALSSNVLLAMHVHLSGGMPEVHEHVNHAGEDGSVAEEYVEDKLNEGERFNWLARPLASDALDYAAAEAKTILRLYQQVIKDGTHATNIFDSQSSAQASSDMYDADGPNSVYKQQQVERRKLLAEGSNTKACPIPMPAMKGDAASHRGSTTARKPKKKTTSWRMPCLS